MIAGNTEAIDMTAEKMMEPQKVYFDSCSGVVAVYSNGDRRILGSDEILAALRSSAVGAGAREALEPFAKLADAADKFDKADDARACCFVHADMADDVFITFGDCRKARSALQSEPVQPAGKGEPTVDALRQTIADEWAIFAILMTRATGETAIARDIAAALTSPRRSWIPTPSPSALKRRG